MGVFLFWSGRRGSTRYRHPTNGRAIRRSPAGPLDLTRCAQVEAASSILPATFQKENTILTDGVSFFVIVHRFCCLHSRPPQGRGSVRGEPLTGSPTRVQSPARRRPLLRSKSATPKRKHHPDGWCFLFGAGYGSRTRLNGLGSRCNTDIPTLRFTYRVIVAYRRRFCNRKLCRKGMNVLSRRIPIEKSLEGTL